MKGIFSKLMFNILKNYTNFIIIYHFYQKKMKITNLHDKTEYVDHVRNLKQAINHRLILKKVHRVIKFNQNAWLKRYTDMNTKLRQKEKIIWERSFKADE